MICSVAISPVASSQLIRILLSALSLDVDLKLNRCLQQDLHAWHKDADFCKAANFGDFCHNIQGHVVVKVLDSTNRLMKSIESRL